MKEIMKKNWERASQYTLAVAQAMPEKGFEFKPVSSVWNFRELVHHIAYALDWMNQVYILQKKADWQPTPVPGSRKEVLKYLTQSIEKVNTGLEKANSEKSTEGFYFMLEHNAHHRGQAVTYLRCQGIEPPEFPF